MKKSSSDALKLKQEQAGVGEKMMQGSLELRLGIISSDNNGGDDPWLGAGAHPWSLASRQEKAAALEQAASAQQPAVGWPPVGAFRKCHLAKTAAEEPASKAKPAGETAAAGMFVKVNLEGCGVGRKVDLRAHRGYASLSRALQGMFRGFLPSDGQWRIAAGRDDDEEEEERRPELGKTKGPTAKNRKTTYILLYEDNEGDRMLVGDVPWELFMASVKRLYIAHDPRKN